MQLREPKKLASIEADIWLGYITQERHEEGHPQGGDRQKALSAPIGCQAGLTDETLYGMTARCPQNLLDIRTRKFPQGDPSTIPAWKANLGACGCMPSQALVAPKGDANEWGSHFWRGLT